jgi:starch phosphorylase
MTTKTNLENTAYIESENTPKLPTVTEFKHTVLRHLHKTLARHTFAATPKDWLNALCYTVRDYLLDPFMTTMGAHHYYNVRRVYYLSMEYLVGRLTGDTIVNLGIYNLAKTSMAELNQDLDDLLEEEVDMGLGNGGLGRLAACFLDSLATLEIPSVGYGVNYEFGLFKQSFINGKQVESPDEWRAFGSPWQIIRPEYQVEVPLYGSVEMKSDKNGKTQYTWKPDSSIIGVPSDIPIVGHKVNTVNFLRLWAAKASCDFDFQRFDEGHYTEAVQDKVNSETVSKVLYPNDNSESGKKLRLIQEYFFVACALSDIIRRHLQVNKSLDNLAEKANVHINDTHPAIAVAELMRQLVDIHHIEWEKAWEITVRICAYTNHTLMPEALEKWQVSFFQEILPRHLTIIRKIDEQFKQEIVFKWGNNAEYIQKLGIIEDGNTPMVRMAHLAIYGSHSVNGVAALHTKLLREQMFPEMDTLLPGRFNNKTNGITPRRWMRTANPDLSKLIDDTIGNNWTNDLDQLVLLEKFTTKSQFIERFQKIKLENKKRLAETIRELCGIEVNPEAIFDIQIKRLHEYKRQHLKLLYIISLYNRLLKNPDLDIQPRVFIFGAKAAPGYRMAKNIIYAINSVADVVNNDPRIKNKIKIAFIPNYRVSLAQKIIPAADVSEQISTAGYEASGTGNMKLALNGALTIGTLDGANVEIRECVGDENIFTFGLSVEEVHSLKTKGYNPLAYIDSSSELKQAIEMLENGSFNPQDKDGMKELCENLKHDDPFLVCADFSSYVKAQNKIDVAYRNKEKWTQKTILNVARCGIFSSDRTIAQYASEIWKTTPIPINEVEHA